MPRLTIGLPVFEGEDFLADAIEGILEQTFTDFVLVISDNASTDATEQICRRFAAVDRRISYERHDVNRGASWNFNRVFDVCTTELFKWASHDDTMTPTFLQACVDELDASPQAVLAYPRTTIIDAEGAAIGDYPNHLDIRDALPHRRLRRLLANLDLANPIFGVIRSDAFARTGRLRPHQASDLVLLAELVMQGAFHEVGDRAFGRRLHAGTSRAANTTARDVAAWFDPARARRALRMPRLRLLVEHARAIAGTDLTAEAKLRCLAVLASGWTNQQLVLVRRRLAGGRGPRWPERLEATV